MRIQSQKLKYEFKRNISIGLALCLLVIIGAGCAAPAEQGSHIKIQSGQTSAEASWPK